VSAVDRDSPPITFRSGTQRARVLTSPDTDASAGIDVRLRRLSRGRKKRLPFAELLIAEFPGNNLSAAQARRRLLDLPVEPWPGQPERSFVGAIDYVGAMVEGGEDLLSRWRAEYGTSRSAVMIIAPVLLATRWSPAPDTSPEADHLDTVVVTSLDWGGSADVAALIARKYGWAYTSIKLLVRAACGGSYTPYGGLFENPLTPAGRSFQRNCELYGQTLLHPKRSGKRQVSALDEPETAVRALREIDIGPNVDPARNPLIMLRMSSRRIKWTAGRRAMARRGRGATHDDQANRDYEHLLALQDDLTRAVEAIPDRPHKIIDTVEPEIEDYEDTETDSTDPDFDAFVETHEQVNAWLHSLANG
jgi:hypothetical protein